MDTSSCNERRLCRRVPTFHWLKAFDCSHFYEISTGLARTQVELLDVSSSGAKVRLSDQEAGWRPVEGQKLFLDSGIRRAMRTMRRVLCEVRWVMEGDAGQEFGLEFGRSLGLTPEDLLDSLYMEAALAVTEKDFQET